MKKFDIFLSRFHKTCANCVCEEKGEAQGPSTTVRTLQSESRATYSLLLLLILSANKGEQRESEKSESNKINEKKEKVISACIFTWHTFTWHNIKVVCCAWRGRHISSIQIPIIGGRLAATSQ